MRHNRRDLSRKLRADAKLFVANCNHCCAGLRWLISRTINRMVHAAAFQRVGRKYPSREPLRTLRSGEFKLKSGINVAPYGLPPFILPRPRDLSSPLLRAERVTVFCF